MYCPTCGKSVAGERGLSQHYAHTTCEAPVEVDKIQDALQEALARLQCGDDHKPPDPTHGPAPMDIDAPDPPPDPPPSHSPPERHEAGGSESSLAAPSTSIARHGKDINHLIPAKLDLTLSGSSEMPRDLMAS